VPERIANGGRRGAALMGVRAVRMAEPVRRELLLQPRRRGRRREDLPDPLVGDRDDSLVGLVAVREKLQRIPGPPADPNCSCSTSSAAVLEISAKFCSN
jgi:hypothetical protein